MQPYWVIIRNGFGRLFISRWYFGLTRYFFASRHYEAHYSRYQRSPNPAPAIPHVEYLPETTPASVITEHRAILDGMP